VWPGNFSAEKYSWSRKNSVSSDGYLSARAEDDGLSHVEKIFQQENTFAEFYT